MHGCLFYDLENSYSKKSLTMLLQGSHFIMGVTILWFQTFKAFTVCLLALSGFMDQMLNRLQSMFAILRVGLAFQ
jgi:hypothetical protein